MLAETLGGVLSENTSLTFGLLALLLTGALGLYAYLARQFAAQRTAMEDANAQQRETLEAAIRSLTAGIDRLTREVEDLRRTSSVAWLRDDMRFLLAAMKELNPDMVMPNITAIVDRNR